MSGAEPVCLNVDDAVGERDCQALQQQDVLHVDQERRAARPTLSPQD